MPDLKTRVANAMRDGRKVLGMSQADLAKAVSVSGPAIAVYELGHTLPRLAVWKRICDELFICSDDVLEGEE